MNFDFLLTAAAIHHAGSTFVAGVGCTNFRRV
jgi:hypothetical protein